MAWSGQATAAVAGQLERLVRPRAAVECLQHSRVTQALGVERRVLSTDRWLLRLLNDHSTAVGAARNLAEAGVAAPAATPTD
jgi:hypothetical protein